MMALKRGDLLHITPDTVSYYADTRWAQFFQPSHIGESVYFAGECNPMQQEDDYEIMFQDGRYLWHHPACSGGVIIGMREAYLATIPDTSTSLES